MDEVLAAYQTRLVEDLAARGIRLDRQARRLLEEQFDDADEAFRAEPDRLDELAANIQQLAESMAAASAVVAEAGTDWRGDSEGATVARYVFADGVERAFLEDCLWPFCRDKK